MPEWQEQDDQQVLIEAQRGDAMAFGELYERHAARVFRYLFSHLNDQLDAEDLTEEVFLRTWQALPRFHERGVPFQAFLFRVAHNALMDHFRQQRRWRWQAHLEDEPVHQQLIEPGQGLEHSAIQGEVQRQLRHWLGQLRPDYRTVLDLRFIAELSPEETALAMGRSAGAVRVLQHRALEALRKLIDKNE